MPAGKGLFLTLKITVFDFEHMKKKKKKKATTVHLQLRAEHIPVSFAIITSIICKGPEELIDKFFYEILRHKNSIVNFTNKKHPASDDFETLPGKQQKNLGYLDKSNCYFGFDNTKYDL